MSDTKRFLFGSREHGESVDVSQKAPNCERRKASRSRALEVVRKVPDIRKDKVTAARRSMISGAWKSVSTRVADRILYEHLFDSTVG
jgi:hypothetical protein